MTKSEKIQATQADAKYGKAGWQWADYATGAEKGITIIHSTNCKCADCSADFD